MTLSPVTQRAALFFIPALAASTALAQEPPVGQQQFVPPAQTELCAEFGLFGDGTALPGDFTLAAFEFHDPGTGTTLDIRSALGETGLHFGADGVAITLPAAVAAISARVGAFDAPVSVIAYDAAFTVQGEATTAANAIGDLSVTGTAIKYVSIEGAEGLLADICITVTIIGERIGGFGGQGAFPGAAGGRGQQAPAGP